MKYIKILSLILIFSFLLAQGLVVFAEDDFCNQVQNISCDNFDGLKEFSAQAKKIEVDCGKDVLSVFKGKINDCTKVLDKEKQQTEEELKDIKNQEHSAERTLKNINFDIKELNTEIAGLNLSISQLEEAVDEKEKLIIELGKALESQKKLLAEILQQFYEYDAASSIEILLGHRSLSDFGDKLEETARLQINLKLSMEEIKNVQKQMEDQKTELEKNKEEKLQNKKAQEISRQSLTARKEQQKYLLGKLTEAKTPMEKEMARMETELMEMKNAMSRIQQYLSQWVLQGQVTWSSIFSAVKNAAGIIGGNPRAALLLGILQEESHFAFNVGKVRNLEDAFSWSPNQLSVYRDICQKLCSAYGDPYCKPETLPLSRDGAMGPAQFIPTSWRAFEKYVISKFPGEVPNPWDLDHALVAMAAYVGRYDTEAAGVKAYNPKGPGWYVPKVLANAVAWQEVIDICGLNLSCPGMQKKLEGIANIPTQ